MACGIYAIRTKDGAAYVGRSRLIDHRWAVHRSQLAKGVHVNQGLQEAYDRDGLSGLTLTVLETCAEEELLARERFYILALRSEDLNVMILKTEVSTAAGQINGRRTQLQPRSRANIVTVYLSDDEMAELDELAGLYAGGSKSALVRKLIVDRHSQLEDDRARGELQRRQDERRVKDPLSGERSS